VSCSVHDVIRLEKAGVPTAAIGTDGFVDEARVQAGLLGMPGYDMVWVVHPVAILDEKAVAGLARKAADEVVARLTAGGA